MTDSSPSIDALQAFMEAGFPGGVPWSITDIGDSVRIEMTATESSIRPGGTVSGPTLMMLADSAAYAMVLSRIGLHGLAVTSNLSIDFLRRPRPGTVSATAHLLKLGRSLAVVRVDLHSAAGEPGQHGGSGRPNLVAHATVTYSMALLERSTNTG